MVGIFFFVGPLLLTLACIFEWIMGNFFSVSGNGERGFERKIKLIFVFR